LSRLLVSCLPDTPPRACGAAPQQLWTRPRRAPLLGAAANRLWRAARGKRGMSTCARHECFSSEVLGRLELLNVPSSGSHGRYAASYPGHRNCCCCCCCCCSDSPAGTAVAVTATTTATSAAACLRSRGAIASMRGPQQSARRLSPAAARAPTAAAAAAGGPGACARTNADRSGAPHAVNGMNAVGRVAWTAPAAPAAAVPAAAARAAVAV
jgi:hypothetical protein